MLIVYDEAFLEHDSGGGHPESADRLIAIVNHLHARGLWDRVTVMAPRAATKEEVSLAHAPSHYNWIRAASARDTWIDADTHAGAGSFDAAVRAAGALLTAADEVMAGRQRRAFCLVRPPGHHALPAQAMGFCLMNNVAIGARYLRERHGVRRMAIVDFDVHHGNGTEEIFRNDPDVFYLSLHRWPFYPLTGGPVVEGPPPLGNRNYPLAADTPAETYHSKLAEGLREVEAFAPEVVLVSAGFDGHEDDPIGGLNLRTEDFGRITRAIVATAEKTAPGRVISTLEGGYGLTFLGPCVEEHLRALDPTLSD